ncbi:cupin [Aeromicrobium sp. Root236]|uniref:cupin domain-containing protein n=1 Tax=Aeromicrobium sp. Root236 TaxID=1736498 RepID=UPI0006F57FF2|nr:cupin domain-containing protein [Aeromicrobium sp. Root236]KRC65798.1 cupin [Aeromicrobium sp. Root236]
MNEHQQPSALVVGDVRTLPLRHAPIDAADVVGGAPTAGAETLISRGDVEVGIWEITSGVVTDIEADEVFIVLSGRGRVEFENGDSIALSAGSAVRLQAGDRTTWVIYETLRKVYVLLPH